MIHQFQSRQFVFFLLTGGIAAIVNFTSRVIYNLWFGFSVSIVLAYVTGMITAFVLARLFVFKETQQPVAHSVLFFVLINLLAVVQTWLVSMGLFYYLLPLMNITVFAREISHGVGIMVPVFTSYLGHKHWSFR